MPEFLPLDFTEDGVTWVALKISGAAGALGAEAIEMRNWLICFRCASEQLRVVIANLSDWMNNSPPSWDAYLALISYVIVALDKRLGMHPRGTGETLRRSLAKLVMRSAGEQAKTACGNLQLCARLEAVIEGETHNVGESKRDMR